MEDTETTTTAAGGDQAAHVETILRIHQGFAASQALFTADALGVFDALAAGPLDLEALAAAVGVKPAPLERLLILCSAVGLLERDGARFRLSDASAACLVKARPGYVGGLFALSRNGMYPLYEHLEHALREQQPQWHRVPRFAKTTPFEAVYRDETSLREFHEAMFSLSYPTAIAAAERLDFSGFRRIVDIGGGTGGFAIGLLERHPGLGGTIFDLPQVERAAREAIARHGLDDRLSFTTGDFFNDPPPAGADLYVLGDILHDWNEADGTRLLEKLYAALPSGGAVCVSEHLLDETRDGPFISAVINVTMLVATHGEQRTPTEFDAWLKRVGFARTSAYQLPAPRGVVMGWKA